MKRLTILMALLLTVSLSAMAQDVVRDSVTVGTDSLAVDDLDTIDDGENVVGAKQAPQRHKAKEANVLGAPVYYDLNGNVLGERRVASGKTPADGVYHRPKHHYLNSLDNRYSSIFVEGELLMGSSNVGVGANLTVLPNRWGGYGSAVFGVDGSHFSLGPALRLSGPESSMDWHLYCGVVLGERHLGAEGGLRMALPKVRGEFCWTSVSMGVLALNGDVCMTFGVSLDMLAVLSIMAWLY